MVPMVRRCANAQYPALDQARLQPRLAIACARLLLFEARWPGYVSHCPSRQALPVKSHLRCPLLSEGCRRVCYEAPRGVPQILRMRQLLLHV